MKKKKVNYAMEPIPEEMKGRTVEQQLELTREWLDDSFAAGILLEGRLREARRMLKLILNASTRK